MLASLCFQLHNIEYMMFTFTFFVVNSVGISNLSHIILCYIANNWKLMERKLEHLPDVYQKVVAEYKYKSDVLTEVNQFALQQF